MLDEGPVLLMSGDKSRIAPDQQQVPADMLGSRDTVTASISCSPGAAPAPHSSSGTRSRGRA